jgi:hypothetical protein
MKRFVEVPGSIDGKKLLRPVAVDAPLQPLAPTRVILVNPKLTPFEKLTALRDLLHAGTEAAFRNKGCPSQGSFQREPMGCGRKK